MNLIIIITNNNNYYLIRVRVGVILGEYTRWSILKPNSNMVFSYMIS